MKQKQCVHFEKEYWALRFYQCVDALTWGKIISSLVVGP